MSRNATDNTKLELLIAEARAAEKAGVFSRTPMDVAALIQQPETSRWIRVYERALVALPLAACLALVVGIASMMGGPAGPDIATTPMVSPAAAPSNGPCSPDVIAACLAGPNMAVSDECRCADFDADGDVDLLDLSSYQKQVASTF